jgi:hypothetical protein
MLEKSLKSFDKTKIAFNHFNQGERDAVVIVCHGFSMSKDTKTFLDLSQDLFKLHDVITIDQRGHGESAGAYSFSSQEHQDIKVVINYAKESYKYIYLMGFSLGAASCIIEVAKEKNVLGLVAVSPPTSFERIENRLLDKDAFIPGIQKFGSHLLKLRIGNMFMEKTRPIDVIDQISPIPLLIIQGERDPTVFSWHAESLYKKAKEPKKIVIIKDGLHAEELYRKKPKDFINLYILWLKEISQAKCK